MHTFRVHVRRTVQMKAPETPKGWVSGLRNHTSRLSCCLLRVVEDASSDIVEAGGGGGGVPASFFVGSEGVRYSGFVPL